MIIKTQKPEENSAKFLANLLVEKLETKKEIVLGLVGGRSAEKVYLFLSKKNLPWNKIHIFLVDERQVPIDDEHSNFKIIKKYFKENLHPYDYLKGADFYSEELKKYGSKFDILFLSAGEDGHIAGLYPNHHSIQDYSEFFIEMNDSPKPPAKRMSASYNLILKSSCAVIIFKGKEKKEALNKFLNQNTTIIDCPSKLVSELDKYYIITDIK